MCCAENHSIMRGHDLWLKQREESAARGHRASRAEHAARSQSASRVRDFVPLNIKSYYSFLDSALSIPAIIETAVERGIKALAITDPNLHGAVEFFTLASEAGIKPIIGAELQSDGRRLNALRRERRGLRASLRAAFDERGLRRDAQSARRRTDHRARRLARSRVAGDSLSAARATGQSST